MPGLSGNPNGAVGKKPRPKTIGNKLELLLHPCLEMPKLLLTYYPGNLLRGAVDSKGDLKDAALQVGIKLDLVGFAEATRG